MAVDFSIIIPSRNRPEMLRLAIESVLRQDHRDKEVIVVDDGTTGDNLEKYRQMEADLEGRVRFFHLVHRPRGHGPSYALDFGASQASGTYLCFLDDDDYWIDDGHLSRAHQVLTASRADVYFANQEAWRDGQKTVAPIWIEDMPALTRHGLQPDAHGAYRVTPHDLLLCTGFAHLNTITVRRTVFEQIGGLDEGIRYEGDRDFYLRLIDQAEVVTYHPAVISRHNIPDPTKSANESTLFRDLQKHLSQLAVLNKSALFAEDPGIRAYCQRHKAYVLKKMTRILASQKEYKTAAYYAREALLIGFSLKWLLYTLQLMARGAFGRK